MSALKNVTTPPLNPPADAPSAGDSIFPIASGALQGAPSGLESAPSLTRRVSMGEVEKKDPSIAGERAPRASERPWATVFKREDFTEIKTELALLSTRIELLKSPPTALLINFLEIEEDLISICNFLDRPDCKFSSDNKSELLRILRIEFAHFRDAAIQWKPELEERFKMINLSWQATLLSRLKVLTASGKSAIMLPFPTDSFFPDVNSRQTFKGSDSASGKTGKLFLFAMGLLVGVFVGGLGMYAFHRFYKT